MSIKLIGVFLMVVPLIWGVLLGVRGVTGKGVVKGSLVVCIALFLAGLLVVTASATVPPGHRGVVLKWGGEVEDKILNEGLSFITPLAESVTAVNIKVQAHPFQNIDAASKEMQNVRLTGNVNWHFDEKYVNWIYQNIGASRDFVNNILDRALQDYLKEVTPQYSVNVILDKRSEIREKTVEMLSTNLSRYHVIVNDVYIADIQFSTEYTAAIERQQTAERQINTERNFLLQKQIQAEQVKVDAEGRANAEVKKAEGDAKATLLRAEAQAKANDMLANSLKGQQELLKYTLYQKIGSEIKVIIIPAGQEFILSPDVLK